MAPQEENPTIEVNKEDLRRAGDLIVMRLMEVQSYIADLGKAYVQHVKTITETGDAVLELPVGPSGFMGNNFTLRAASPAARSDAGGPKKRKRAPADPNAPKRALTPYFLYMQHNRSKIAEDLGGDARPKEVADEGTRRWQSMDPAQKEVWKELYASNYNEYKEAMAVYKATGQAPKVDNAKGEDDHEDPAASQLQQGFAGVEAAEETDSSSSSDEEEEEESPSPPVKEKTPPRSSAKKARRSDTKAKEVETPAKSPVKRGRKAAIVPEPVSVAKTPAEKRSRATKKRKSEA